MKKLIGLIATVLILGYSTPTIGSIFAGLDQQLEALDTSSHVWTEDGYLFRCRLTNSSDEQLLLQIWHGEEIIYAVMMDPHTEEYTWLHGGHYAFQWKKSGASRIEDWIYRGWGLNPKAAFIYNKTLDAWETTNKDFENVQ